MEATGCYSASTLHSGLMTAARTFLIDALQRVADGGDMDETEIEAAVPDPFALDDLEKKAWEELSHWADDKDIRVRNERYAGYKRDRMRECIATFNARGK
jgi:hypothetical protein|tara:strand:+ start:7150 stop:7449 length:300 start_codon:yes stop_codon:yes gene_type:complete